MTIYMEGMHLIKYYRYVLSTYYYFNPFKTPYQCYNIRLELAYKFSVIKWSPVFSDPSWAIIRECICQKYNIAFYWFWCIIFLNLVLSSANVIILSCRQHGYPWPSLTTPPNLSLLLAGPLGYIPYPHRTAECMFELVVLLLLDHMWGSIGVHHLWARPCFSSSVLHVWFV